MKLGAILKRAWHLVHGSKAALWGVNLGVLLISLVVMIGLAIALTPVFYVLGHEAAHSPLFSMVFPLVSTVMLSALLAPLVAGTLMVAIKHARGETVDAKTGYRYYFAYWGRTVLVFIVISSMIFLVSLGLNLLTLFFTSTATPPTWLNLLSTLITLLIYVFFMFALPAVIDQNLSAVKALAFSARIVKPHWFKVFLVLLMASAIVLLSLVPGVLIGLAGLLITPDNTVRFVLAGVGTLVTVLLFVWSVPFSFLLLGETYKQLT